MKSSARSARAAWARCIARATPSCGARWRSNPTSLPRGVFVEGGSSTVRNFDIARDGRLLAVVLGGQTDAAALRAPQIQVVLNWFEELKQRIPVK